MEMISDLAIDLGLFKLDSEHEGGTDRPGKPPVPTGTREDGSITD